MPCCVQCTLAVYPALEAGASDYLAKPVNTDQLLATLRNWLHR